MQSKSVYSSNYDFIVDTDYATYIESQDSLYHSYTFPVYRTFETELVENLLLTLQDDGTYGVVLMAYDLTTQEKENLSNGIQPNCDGKISATILENFNTDGLFNKFTNVDCVTAVYSYCEEDNHLEGFLNGEECPAYAEQVVTYCTDGGGANYSYYSGEVSSLNEDGNYNAGSGGVNGSHVATQPFYATQPWENIAQCMLNIVDINGAINWLIDNKTQAGQIEGFLSTDNCSIDSQNYGQEIIESGIDNNLVSTIPFIKYPEDLAAQYKEDYPYLTEYLKNKLPEVVNIPLIISTINSITNLSAEQIKEDLKWGNGPELNIVQLDDFGENTTSTTVGFFRVADSNSIYLDIDYVNGLENGTTTQYEKDALLFFLGTTILHEYVHYGDNTDGVDYPGEEGTLFEILVYGENVTSYNAALILNGN